MSFRSGFCVLAGRPNTGKSTLLNALVGSKVAIVSPRPQTTRSRIVGVRHGEQHQIVFLDTPGIHRPRHRLGEYMVKVAVGTLRGVDVVGLVVDAGGPPGQGDEAVARMCRESGSDVVVIFNKIDIGPKKVLEPRLEAYTAWGWPVFPVSAARGTNIEALAQVIANLLPEGPQYYPEDMITDQPERRLVEELIREQVLKLTREEVPHGVAVQVEEFAERPDGMVYIAATIFVERDSHRKIIIGGDGQMIRDIGRHARMEVETLLGSRLYLDLWVKVSRDWRDRDAALRRLGYGPEE